MKKTASLDLDTIARLAWPEATHLASPELPKREKAYLTRKIPQLHDPLFPTYNANLIPGTFLAAAEGPSDLSLTGAPIIGNVARFFENTVFNEKFPVQMIVALGHFRESRFGDFDDYFSVGEHQFPENEQAKSNYMVNSKERTKITSIRNNFKKIDLCYYELMISHPKKSPRRCDVVWIPTPDLQPVLISNPAVCEELYQIYSKSKKLPMVIHCAAGVGRTGTILLAFKILDHFHEIFSQSDLEIIAGKIKEQLLELRKVRPAFVSTLEQLKSAINCALQIYKVGKEWIIK